MNLDTPSATPLSRLFCPSQCPWDLSALTESLHELPEWDGHTPQLESDFYNTLEHVDDTMGIPLFQPFTDFHKVECDADMSGREVVPEATLVQPHAGPSVEYSLVSWNVNYLHMEHSFLNCQDHIRFKQKQSMLKRILAKVDICFLQEVRWYIM